MEAMARVRNLLEDEPPRSDHRFTLIGRIVVFFIKIDDAVANGYRK